MLEAGARGFGILIAFVAPGALVVLGASLYSPVVASWLGSTSSGSASGAGFLFVLLASLTAGVFVSGPRHELLVPLFERAGTKVPEFDESLLGDEQVRLAHAQAIEDFYRYHQFYGNMALASLATYFAWLDATDPLPSKWWVWAGIYALALFLLLKSAKYSLDRYFEVLAALQERRGGSHE